MTRSRPAALIFYLLYVAILTMLVIEPASRIADPVQAGWEAGLIGLAAYAAYNLTNVATLKN
jgi:uncharacterized membrane protein